MKRWPLFFIVALLWVQYLSAQHLSFISVDSSRFPQMSARIFLMADVQGARELPYLQVEIHDNGNFCSASPTPAPADVAQRASTLMMCMDISQSSEEFPEIRQLSRYAVESIANKISFSSTDVGLCFFDNLSHIACDYTSERSKFMASINKAFVGRATSYSSALMEPKTGALSLVAPKSSRNSIVLIADGYDSVDVEAIASKAKSLNCRIYCMGIGSFSATWLQQIAESTGGYAFGNLLDSSDVADAAATIAGIASGLNFVDVSWRSLDIASAKHYVTLTVPSSSRSVQFEYSVHDQKRARVEHTGHLIFGAVSPRTTSNAPIAVQGLNFDITIDSVAFSGMPYFRTTQTFPLTIPAFKTVDIPIIYSPKDSSYVWSRLTLYTAQCGPSSVTMSGGYPGYPADGKCLKILKPLAGDLLPIDTYVPVEWEGSPPNNFNRVELSVDDGQTWKTVQENVPGNLLMMKTPREPHERCRLRVTQKAAQSGPGSAGIQNDVSEGSFSFINPSSFVSDVRMNPTIIGKRKDKSFSSFIKNLSRTRLKVELAEIGGDHPNDFAICSQAPPYYLNPGETHELELAFTPTAKGMRNARVNIKTSAGYASCRVSGFGIESTTEVKPLLVDFGDVQTEDSVSIRLPNVLYNHGDYQIVIKKMFLIGPDTTQFGMFVPNTLPTLKHNEGMNLSVNFHPTVDGRTSSEAVIISDAEDSPHILQLYGNAMAHVRDVTGYREVISPTAQTMKAGTYAVGDVDFLGVVGYYGITDNIMLQAGGVLPLPLDSKSTLVYSLGIKGGLPITRSISLAVGYQFGKSRYDNSQTDGVESNVTVHAPYIVGTYGNDDARVSAALGYAFKHHVTLSEPNGFDANAMLATLSGDYRIGARWKLCGETYTFASLGYVPLVATVRYLGNGYTIDVGAAYIGLTTGSTEAPKTPLLPVISAIWNF